MQDPKKLKPGDYVEYGKLWLKLGNVDSAGYYYNKGLEGDTARNKTDIYRQIAEALRNKKDSVTLLRGTTSSLRPTQLPSRTIISTVVLLITSAVVTMLQPMHLLNMKRSTPIR
ncbi:MAG: hypothetical protein EBZ77_18005 [Chitinophagia bacterium]|nr:hypothetical protein [Chitinophagia bacterium]